MVVKQAIVEFGAIAAKRWHATAAATMASG